MPACHLPTVLIIDDVFTIRKLLHTILSKQGYPVIGEAVDGEQGLMMALSLRPQVIFLDIDLPKINGLDLLIRILGELPTTLVLIVSGSNDRDTVKAALAGGASGFIVKPFSVGKVLDAMKQMSSKIMSDKAMAKLDDDNHNDTPTPTHEGNAEQVGTVQPDPDPAP